MSYYDRLKKRFDERGEDAHKWAEESVVIEGTVGDDNDTVAYRKVVLGYLDEELRPIEHTLSIMKLCGQQHALHSGNRLVGKCCVCSTYLCQFCLRDAGGEGRAAVCCRYCGQLACTAHSRGNGPSEARCVRSACRWAYWRERVFGF